MGTQKGLETKLVPREGFELKTIRVRGFVRRLSLDTLVAVKELFQGIFEARSVLRKFKPDIVIGTGGYVCGPVVFNAALMSIPTVIHEQNAFPGVTNRLLARFVDAVAISFKESTGYFKSAKNLVLTGNPIRAEILQADRATARRKLGIPHEAPLVVVFGGSRGAERINESAAEMLLKHHKSTDFHAIFATGEAQFEKINGRMGGNKLPAVNVVPYIFNMGDVMAAADLMICRAGAITIGELTAMGVPSVIIPSPYVTANHQEHNARALEEQGAAVVILEKDLNGHILYNQVMDLLKNREQLSKMSRNARKAGITNATEKIYSIVQELKASRK